MASTLIEQLLSVARTYAGAKDLSLARVSTLVLNRGSTLERLESGDADVNTKTLERALEWFSDNWPEKTRWPAGVPRPRKPAENAA